ncbi:unnamed protein product [Soboliphyme baturini]|uniref:Transmembrane protein n=1 Tax=Soboliphyme baturini TaxID=241478 RepID=A0A183IZQ4_9BILA|nr:unnamed protein product [Soboliphyme baturini]
MDTLLRTRYIFLSHPDLGPATAELLLQPVTVLVIAVLSPSDRNGIGLTAEFASQLKAEVKSEYRRFKFRLQSVTRFTNPDSKAALASFATLFGLHILSIPFTIYYRKLPLVHCVMPPHCQFSVMGNFQFSALGVVGTAASVCAAVSFYKIHPLAGWLAAPLTILAAYSTALMLAITFDKENRPKNSD